jgi:small subunit ribosomal protein S7
MEVRARRIGGAAYQVPVQVRGRRQEALSIRWLVESARSRSNSEYHTFAEKLAAEIMDAAKGEGVAVKKRQDVEKVAEANKAFAHFRW